MAEQIHNGRSGLELLEAEIARQQEDALISIGANAEMAGRVAASVEHTERLLLVGMGASHYANRIAEPRYRRLGIEAWALSTADLLQSPLPPAQRTAIVVSQSGESGEIPELLARLKGSEHNFGMTLDPQSTLGRTLRCLVGAGGAEIAFAATRSLTVTLALHAAVLAALGENDDGAAESLQDRAAPATDAAVQELAGKQAVVFSGRGPFRGLAESAALMLMELARMPAFGFELGQFRHGPMELLSPMIGVVLLRGAADDEAAIGSIARAAIEAGSTPVVVDCSGRDPIAQARTLAFAKRQGLGAVLAVLPSLQRLIIDIAALKVDRVGEPVRSTKITRAAS